MKFCQKHWDALRHAIQQRGLSDFIAKDGFEAMQQLKGQLEGKPETKQNYDPLMSAHWMIVNNAMDTLSQIGASPLMLLSPPEDHSEYECPICCLNSLSLEHDRTCTEPNCRKKRGLTFDDWIEKAADGAAEHVKSLMGKK